MARTLRYLFVLLLIGVSGSAFAQEIAGRVLDEKKQPVIGAVVHASAGGIVKGGAVTDYDGNYSIKPLDAGRYDVEVNYTGYKKNLTTGVLVSPDKTTGLNVQLEVNTKQLNEVTVTAYKVPLIDKYAPGGSTTITSDQIEKMPTRNIAEVAATTPGVYQQTRNSTSLNLAGARSDGTQYIIDGVRVQGTQGINLSQGAIDQVQVLTSGVPAKYGDISGGVINITTKGTASKITGDILAQHSVEGYNNNLLSATLTGPLYSKKTKDGKKPIIGFLLGADGYYDEDRNPSYIPAYVPKADVLQKLTQNPLTISSDESGNPVYKYSSEYITKNDLDQVKRPDHNKTLEGRLNGKLDFQLGNNLTLTAGGNFDYRKADNYSSTSIIFAPNSIPTIEYYTSRGWVRFSQRFGKTGADATKSGAISNAYYQIQASYQNESNKYSDPRFGTNIFNYNYIGKFNQEYRPLYQAGIDSASGLYGTKLVAFYNPVDVTYQRSELNPELANYTSEYYNSLTGLPQTISEIQASNALVNGDMPRYTYGLFTNVGAGLNGYRRQNQNQYSLSVDASFDLQLGHTKHSIEFGLYYEQRIERYFVALANLNGQGTASLWQLMRQLTNSHITLDKGNPIFVVNGKQYTYDQVKSGQVRPGPGDTILYNNVANQQTQSAFDRNLRQKLGMDPNGTDYINVDAQDPSTYSLNMFSADELLNSGNPFVIYYGYSYDGTKQNGNVSFNDFWTQKDANGNYTRPIGAFRPNYTAGYILDKFTFKDMLFNVGLRVERYDAQTQVLKDPYSLYDEYTVDGNNKLSSATQAQNVINGGTPSNIGGNYVVYVDDNSAKAPNIVGYRNGDSWYDAKGQYIEDPASLKAYTGGRDPQPYVVKNGNAQPNIQDTTFNPSNSFTNYTPQVSVLPRISFSFPISDVALFYAHYDIYSSRPTDGYINTTPADYYFLQQNSNQIINNPALLPQKTYDYEVGFQQKLTNQSSVTISAFYREYKNLVGLRPYLDAWPTTYYTWGNRDFATTKGVTLKYDLRRLNHLRMNVSYTLQFAEGTGSTPTSGNGDYGSGQISPNGLLQNFIEAQLPNLRYFSALDYDSRHNIVVSADYRFDEGEGPIVGGLRILQNAGLNLLFKARSGEPYTRYAVPDVVSRTVVGGVNQSRLPWHYNVDLRIDKNFALTSAKRNNNETEGAKPKRPLYLNAFVYVQNLLNTKDIIHVYGYTGRPDDNGYLTSSYGQSYIPLQTSPASYMDLYQIYYNSSGNYNLPRAINIGVEFNF